MWDFPASSSFYRDLYLSYTFPLQHVTLYDRVSDKFEAFDGTQGNNFQGGLGKVTSVLGSRKLYCGIPKMEEALAIEGNLEFFVDVQSE